MVRGDPAEQRRAVAHAVEAGFRYFDTAPSYGDGRSEQNLGRVLGELGSAAPTVVVGTKVRVEPALAAGADAATTVPRLIRESIEASLRRLQRPRVHLLQLHTRIVDAAGDEREGRGLTVEQVLGPVLDGLRGAQTAGLTEHVGITATGDTAAVQRVIASGALDTAQVYFNALNPSAGWAGRADAGDQDFGGIVDQAAGRAMGVIVIRPLAAGAVSARTERHPNAGAMRGAGGGIAGESYAGDVARAQELANLAAASGLEGPVELALRFALATPGVSTVLVGFSDATQLGDAIRWAERGPLAPDAVTQVLALRGR
jgi:L-galactose dehydrogenase/L-glyceraldehyde 3-phosphate reductase